MTWKNWWGGQLQQSKYWQCSSPCLLFLYTFIHALSLQPLHFRHFSLRLFPRLLLLLDTRWIMLCCMIVLPVMSLPHQHQAKSLCNFERAWHGAVRGWGSHWRNTQALELPWGARPSAEGQALQVRGSSMGVWEGKARSLTIAHPCAERLLLSPPWAGAQRVQEGLLAHPWVGQWGCHRSDLGLHHRQWESSVLLVGELWEKVCLTEADFSPLGNSSSALSSMWTYS